MPEQSTVISILIASPGDLQAERDRIPHLFTRWSMANPGVHLSAVMWESSSVPELGDHPQHSLDRRLIPKSELLVAMFWSKIGTPTPTAPSGTIEEIREFIRLKGPKRVMLYFCDRPLEQGPSTIDATAISLLQEFKEEMREQGVYESFVTPDQFESKLYHNLDIKIAELLSDRLPLPDVTTETPEHNSHSWCGIDHPDSRLRVPIDFGTKFPDIAKSVAERVQHCIDIGGATNDNFLDLGGHIFQSAGHALNELLDKRPYDVPIASRNALRSVAQRLKAHGENSHTYVGKPWRQYYQDGQELSNEVVRICNSKAL